MQTVPLEFVAQLRPLMFVAGLRTPGDKASSSTDVKNANAASNGPAVNGEPPLAQSQNPARTPKADTDAFAELSETLATTLSTHRSSAIFEPGPVASGTADAENRVRFNVILVDKVSEHSPVYRRCADNSSMRTFAFLQEKSARKMPLLRHIRPFLHSHHLRHCTRTVSWLQSG